MTAHTRFPRGVLAVRAQGGSPDVQAAIDAVNRGFEAFKATYDGKVDALSTNMQAAIDDLNAKYAAGGMVAAGADMLPVDPDYTRAFASFARRGQNEGDLQRLNAEGHRAQVQAAMSVGSNGDGGYLAPVEWDRKISQALVAVSPMRGIANVVQTSVRAYSTLWNNAAWGSGWVGETANRPQTTTPNLSPVLFESGEIYANPAITQQLLDDAQFDISQWIETSLSVEFGRQEGIAFISGDGVNKPRGFLTYVAGGASATTHPGGVLVQVPTGQAASVTADGLMDLVIKLTAPYRQNARFVMNSMTEGAVRKLKDGQGAYLWQIGLTEGRPATLLGFPITIDENMPNIAAGALPIAFGDFRAGYTINDRMATRVLRDPYTAKPYVLFYATKRVGAGVADPNAIVVQKVAAS